MSERRSPQAHGRGAQINPPNRYAQWHGEADLEYLEHDPEEVEKLESLKTEYLPDVSRSIVSENDSPDIPFRYSVNPYRGCQHGCPYCYARPSHEYLGLSAGLDFETKIFVKHEAPALFREWLSRPKYVPEPVMFSGITDCYQPAERMYKLTRGCLEVARDARQPVGIITKNALVARDMDVLREMAQHNIVRVALSVTSLDAELARRLEPRTSAPAARLRAVRAFAEAGVPVHVMIGPVIPAINDSEIPAILAAAAEAGANGAGYNLLRLPLTIKPVFLDWLEREQPTAKDRVESLIRSTRSGRLNDTNFGARMRGTGPIADQIRQTFRVFARKHKLDGPWSPLETSHFRPPRPTSGQLRLF